MASVTDCAACGIGRLEPPPAMRVKTLPWMPTCIRKGTRLIWTIERPPSPLGADDRARNRRPAVQHEWGCASPAVGGGEVVPRVVEIENGGSSGPGGVAWTAFDHERRNRHEKKVHETR